MKKKIFVIVLSAVLVLTVAQVVIAQTTTPNALQNPGVGIKKGLKARMGIGTLSANKPQLDIACVKSAVEKRESAVIAAYDKKTAAIKTALTTRKTALKEAWDKTTIKERLVARLAAWKAFRAAKLGAQKVYVGEIKAVWRQFKTDRKSCGVTETNNESQGTDIAL